MGNGAYIIVHIYSACSYIRGVIINGEEILLSQAIILYHRPPRKRLSKRLVELYIGVPHNFILYQRILPQKLRLMQSTAQKIYKVQVRWEIWDLLY